MGTKWHLGTMGFSYQDWRGAFYPEKLPAARFLPFYSRFFNAVEIDSTFYGSPAPETIIRWKSLTPEPFRFCLKTPREVTHDLQLQGARATDAMFTFLERVKLLETKLGVVLLQFSPRFTAASLETLGDFLAQLPDALRYAVEFRHPSWFQPETAALLAGVGVSWAATEYPGVPANLNLTAPHVYVRWIGQHGRYDRHDRERVDMSKSLQAWKKQLHSSLTGEHTVFGFFNNDYAGFAPGTCTRFMAMLGIRTRSFHQPRQGRLF